MSEKSTLLTLLIVGASGPSLAAPPMPSAVPGFVVYGVATTLVVPRVGEPRVLPGLWVLDDDGKDPPAVRGLVNPEHCECPSVCTGTRADASKTLLEAMPDSGRGGESDCGWSIREPRSLFGGRLELAGEDYNGCGLNLYGFGSRSVDLVRHPRPLERAWTTGERWCEVESSLADAIWPPGADECRAYRGSWIPGDWDAEALAESENAEPADDADPDPCQECARETWGSELHFVRRGLLVTIRDDVQGTGMQVRQVAFARATPAACPSEADPCGDAAAFSAVPGVRIPAIPKAPGEPPPEVEKGPDFWIASDGSHALTWSALAWALWVPGQNTPARSGSATALFDHVIGVRYHRDVTPLVGGSCSALCSEPSQCPDVKGADDREEDEEEEEEEEEDSRSASDLGNACFKALKADDLDEAETLCTRALGRSPVPRTLGAVLYNLGLIAEKRGDTSTARKHYESSLKARPNKTVEARLQKLEER
ncbi:MAG: tetratricopeptide repeat protein [Myxococcales bacterium]|nr:tetratricopeptide repeat protein [Myxococcales bacterium]